VKCLPRRPWQCDRSCAEQSISHSFASWILEVRIEAEDGIPSLEVAGQRVRVHFQKFRARREMMAVVLTDGLRQEASNDQPATSSVHRYRNMVKSAIFSHCTPPSRANGR
jgi:hypothetical protein